VERLFAGFSSAPPLPSQPARYVGSEMRDDRRAEQAHLMLGFGGVSYLDDAYDAVQVFTSAVGGGMSSRLFQDIRETRGLAYSIYAFHAPYHDSGAFGIYAGTDPKKTRELALVTLDVLARATEDLSEVEIRRAKAQSKVALLSAHEAAAPRASFMARSLLAYGRVLSREELTGRIDRLSVEDVRAAGRALLETPMAVAAVGPLKKLPRIEELRRHMDPARPVAAPALAARG
ncbi:MAG: M16 family metallopeptidase, partial [Hyphomicrobiales bacterium]